MSDEAYLIERIITHCEWYFGRPVKLLTFVKDSTTHCVVVPAHSTLRSSAERGVSDILISNSAEQWSLLYLHDKVQQLIGRVYAVGESGELGIDEAKVPPECLVEPATMASVAPDPLRRFETQGELERRSAAAGDMPGTLHDSSITDGTQVSRGQSIAAAGSPVDRDISTATPPRGIPMSTLSRSASPRFGNFPLGILSPTAAADCHQAPVATPISILSPTAEVPLAQLNRDIVKEEVDRALARAVADLAMHLGRAT